MVAHTLTEPKFKKGDRVFILTTWEARRGSSFVVDKIKTRRGIHFYFDNTDDWTHPFYLETFDGWWEEDGLSLIKPEYEE